MEARRASPRPPLTEVYPHGSTYQCFIPFYGQITVIVWMLHFIHSSSDGHWCCVHFLATVSNAAMNSCVRVFVWTLENPPHVSLVTIPGNDPESGSPDTVRQRARHLCAPPNPEKNTRRSELN